MRPPPDGGPAGLSSDIAARLVAQAGRDYFAGCRARIGPFVESTFNVRARPARSRSLGFQLARAPARLAGAVPDVGVRFGSAIARGAARLRTPDRSGDQAGLGAAVERELAWRVTAELLRRPCVDGPREAREDALAEAVLLQPPVMALLRSAGSAVAARGGEPCARARLEAVAADYAGDAGPELVEGLIALGRGRALLNPPTPGGRSMGARLTGDLMRPRGAASPGVPARVAAFAGAITDPARRAIGDHQRRLENLVGALEADFDLGAVGDGSERDRYVGGLLALAGFLDAATQV